jgi:hypothetical protein
VSGSIKHSLYLFSRRCTQKKSLIARRFFDGDLTRDSY